MGDKDEALHYLLNKLKSDDGWSGSNLAWNVDKLSVIADMFRALDGIVKVKVLLSFLSMPPRTISQCSGEMNQVLRLARRDGDEWVRLFASVLGHFPENHKISATHVTEDNMDGLVQDLEESITEEASIIFIPHEYAYLNQTVLMDSHGYQPPSSHSHFVLKKKSQASVALKQEILQRAGTDFSQTGSLVKDRHLLQRQMSSTLSGSASFLPTVRAHSSRKVVSTPTNKVQRERGTKLLDINEVPLSNRRKRKTITAEDGAPGVSSRPEGKKQLKTPLKTEPEPPTPLTPLPPETPMATATPDYAAGLGTELSASSMYADHSYSTNEPSPLISPSYSAPKLSPPPTPQPTHVPPFVSDAPVAQQPEPPSSLPQPTPSSSTAQQQPARQPNKGLKLSRHQLLVAQDMFNESPNLSKAQKALILGFMAGSRENPNPGQSVLTIKLNERQDVEEVALPGGGGMAKRNVTYETVFEMNYGNGQWRKLQIKRAYPAMKQ